MKSNLKLIVGIVIGVIVSCGIGYVVAENIAASSITYTNNNQSTVDGALDDLYSKAASNYRLTLANYIENMYLINGEGANGLYKHDGQGTYGSEEAGDNSYRYSGGSDEVKNFVCFGSDATTCDYNDLYRIIGVFDGQVKLVKYNYLKKTYAYNNSSKKERLGLGTSNYVGEDINVSSFDYGDSIEGNHLANSGLIKLLNCTGENNTNCLLEYYKDINVKWYNMIANHEYKTGPINTTNVTAKELFAKEITNNYSFAIGNSLCVNSTTVCTAEHLTYTTKIALMYGSDYRYISSPNTWSEKSE